MLDTKICYLCGKLTDNYSATPTNELTRDVFLKNIILLTPHHKARLAVGFTLLLFFNPWEHGSIQKIIFFLRKGISKIVKYFQSLKKNYNRAFFCKIHVATRELPEVRIRAGCVEKIKDQIGDCPFFRILSVHLRCIIRDHIFPMSNERARWTNRRIQLYSWKKWRTWTHFFQSSPRDDAQEETEEERKQREALSIPIKFKPSLNREIIAEIGLQPPPVRFFSRKHDLVLTAGWNMSAVLFLSEYYWLHLKGCFDTGKPYRAKYSLYLAHATRAV